MDFKRISADSKLMTPLTNSQLVLASSTHMSDSLRTHVAKYQGYLESIRTVLVDYAKRHIGDSKPLPTV